MKKIKINDTNYELIKDNGSCFNYEEFIERVTDYFYDYDYIFADYSYNRIRIKGFYDASNKNVNNINNINTLDEYISNYCPYGAKYFLLKKVK